MVKWIVMMCLFVACAVAYTGCGGSSNSASSGNATLTVSGDAQ